MQEARLEQNAFQVIHLLLGVFVLRIAFNNSEKRFTLNLTVKHIIKTWQLQKKSAFLRSEIVVRYHYPRIALIEQGTGQMVFLKDYNK